MKNTKGITLIALVITIIVLMILAGISIAMLTGENGILTQAMEAEIENRAGTVEDERNLWINLQYTAKYGEDVGFETIEQITKRLWESKFLTDAEYNNGDLTDPERDADGNLTRCKAVIGKRVIEFYYIGAVSSGDGTTPPTENQEFEIGDYVAYIPQSDIKEYTEMQYESEGNSYLVEQNSSTAWRILDINTDGTIDLVSDQSVGTIDLALGSYSNFIYYLNDMASVLYSNEIFGATARNLNLEDLIGEDKPFTDISSKVVDEFISDDKIMSTGQNYRDLMGGPYHTLPTFLGAMKSFAPDSSVTNKFTVGRINEEEVENDEGIYELVQTVEKYLISERKLVDTRSTQKEKFNNDYYYGNELSLCTLTETSIEVFDNSNNGGYTVNADNSIVELYANILPNDITLATRSMIYQPEINEFLRFGRMKYIDNGTVTPQIVYDHVYDQLDIYGTHIGELNENYSYDSVPVVTIDSSHINTSVGDGESSITAWGVN